MVKGEKAKKLSEPTNQPVTAYNNRSKGSRGRSKGGNAREIHGWGVLKLTGKKQYKRSKFGE